MDTFIYNEKSSKTYEYEFIYPFKNLRFIFVLKIKKLNLMIIEIIELYM